MDWLTNHPKQALLICGILFVLVALWFLFVAKAKTGVARLGGLTWKRNQFCRGWLITGDTGSGKTSSGVNQLAHQVFQNEPTWGGLCIDEKGVYWETLAAMARHYNREHDLIHLQIRADDTDTTWTTSSLQPDGRPNHPVHDLRQVRRGHGHELGPERRQRFFQEPGTDAHRTRFGDAVRVETACDTAWSFRAPVRPRPARRRDGES